MTNHGESKTPQTDDTVTNRGLLVALVSYPAVASALNDVAPWMAHRDHEACVQLLARYEETGDPACLKEVAGKVGAVSPWEGAEMGCGVEPPATPSVYAETPRTYDTATNRSLLVALAILIAGIPLWIFVAAKNDNSVYLNYVNSALKAFPIEVTGPELSEKVWDMPVGERISVPSSDGDKVCTIVRTSKNALFSLDDYRVYGEGCTPGGLVVPLGEPEFTREQ